MSAQAEPMINEIYVDCVSPVLSLLLFLICISEYRAPVFMAGPAGGLVLPAQVWLSGVPMDGNRDQQTRARPESKWCSLGWSRTRRVWAEGVSRSRFF